MKTKKAMNLLLAAVVTFSSLGLTKIENADAMTLNSHENTILKKIAGSSYNRITKKSVSYSYKTTGTKSPSAYQWTAWYNRYIKDFTIDKSKTSGTYRNGFPKKTSSATTSTNFDKIGYFKYLRDPIYSNITLTANATYRWTTKDTVVDKVNVKGSGSVAVEGKDNDLMFGIGGNPVKEYTKVFNKDKFRSLRDATGKTDKQLAQLLKNADKDIRDWGNEDPNGNVRSQLFATFKVGDITVKVNTVPKVSGLEGGVYSNIVKVSWSGTKKKNRIVYNNHSKTVEVAKTKVASNVSATELIKFKPIALQWKGGGTAKKNTTIGKKSSAGWWRQHNPPYHGGTRTTSDTGGGYHYYTFSTNGTEGVSKNLYNMITEKERIFTQQSKTSTPIANYKYKLTINPNGGEYLNSTANKTVTSQMNSSTTVYKPYRKGYLFTGWKHVGEGTWDAASARFTFTGDSTLTAQWIKNNGPGPEGNSHKPTPPGGDRDPGTPIKPPNPGCDGDGCQPGVTPDGNRKEYTLTIDPNGGKYNYSTKVSKVTKQAGSYTSINAPRRSGYIFDGWQVVEGNSSYLSQGKYTKPSTYVFYGNARIKAKWLRNNSQNGTLVVDPNGGVYEGSTNKKTYTAKSGYSLAVRNPTRDGYQFVGWDIDTNNDVNGIFDTSSNSFMFKRGKSTLKARWKKFVPDNCIIDGTGPNACPEMDIVLPKFIHLTKNPGEWDD